MVFAVAPPAMALLAPDPVPLALPQRLRLGVLASGSGSNFEALVAASRSGQLNAEVVSLVVNNRGCRATERAARLGVATTLIDHRHHVSREALDAALLAHFAPLQLDLLVMAGWMRIVTPVLCDAFRNRIVNIHPSLLPAFPGLHAMEQALAAGVRITGCTAHLVVPEVDAGPILAQAAIAVREDETLATLAPRLHAAEHRILPQAVVIAAQRLARQVAPVDQG